MKRILCSMLCCLMLSHASAFNISSAPLKTYLSVGSSFLFPSVKNNNVVQTGDGWPDDRYTSKSTSNEPAVFISTGYTLNRDSNWLPAYSLGMKFLYASSLTTHGHIEQYSLPDFQNYRYEYDIHLLNLLATAKVDLYRYAQWMPYFTAGLGLARYRATHYKEYANDNVTPRVSPAFGAHASNNFIYAMGFGLDYLFNDTTVINLEYNYMDLGSIRTGKGANTSTLTGTNYADKFLKNKLSTSLITLGVTFYLS